MELKYEIIDNLLAKEDFLKIKNFILGPEMHWIYNDEVANPNEHKGDFYFTHTFYSEFVVQSPFMELLNPVVKMLKAKAFYRIKANLYPNLNKIIFNNIHTDADFNHKGAIFYINTNNGFTILEDKTEIKSIENRLLLFDSSRPHQSTHCTDQKIRVNINFNYF